MARNHLTSPRPQIVSSTLSELVFSQSLWSVVPFLLGSACYLNSLGGDLVHDDIFAIKENPDILPSTHLSKLFYNDFWGEPMSSVVSHKSYRPLTVLTFRLNYLLHGLEPWGYHVFNLLLHGVATLLFGWFCRREVFGLKEPKFSMLAMLLFATHPVHTEAVAGVVGRADVLACIMFLLSLLLYCSATRATTGWNMLSKLLLSIISGSAAMLCKEHGATVFGVCLTYDLLVANRTTLTRILRGRVSFLCHTYLLIRLVVLLVSTGILLGLRLWLLHGHLPHFSAHDNPASFADSVITRVLTYSFLTFFNFRLLLYPYTLCYDWQMGSIPLLHSLSDPRNIFTLSFYFFLICLTWSALWGRGSRSHAPIVGLLLLVIPFLPASNLLIRVGFVVAERILYIPSMGWCILVTAGAHTFYCYRPSLRLHLVRDMLLLLALFSLLLALFSARTINRNLVWENKETLFRSALVTVPNNAKVHFNYANFLKDNGRGQEAIEFYRTAIRLSPDHAVSHNNLGSLLSGKEAEFHFRQAIHHHPHHFKAYYNLGKNLQAQGRALAEVEAAFRESLNIRPTYVDSLMGLALLLAEDGRGEEGLGLMERAVNEAPLNPDVHNNMAAFLLTTNDLQGAVSAYQEAVRLDSQHVTALTSLARVYRSLGEDDKAEETFQRSLSVKEDPSTFLYLGSMLHNTGRLDDAQRAFKQGLNLDPHRTDLLCSLGQALVQGGSVDEARTVLEEAISAHPSSGCLNRVIGMLYFKQNQLNQAIDHLSRAEELTNESEELADILHSKGGMLVDQGKLNEAEQCFRAALSLSPDRSSTRMNLGAILHIKKDYVQAAVEYHAALKIDPDNTVILENLHKLERAAAAARHS